MHEEGANKAAAPERRGCGLQSVSLNGLGQKQQTKPSPVPLEGTSHCVDHSGSNLRLCLLLLGSTAAKPQ